MRVSAKLMPEVFTATRSWPGPGCGSSISSHCITSGPPKRRTIQAFMASADRQQHVGELARLGDHDVMARVDGEPGPLRLALDEWRDRVGFVAGPALETADERLGQAGRAAVLEVHGFHQSRQRM